MDAGRAAANADVGRQLVDLAAEGQSIPLPRFEAEAIRGGLYWDQLARFLWENPVLVHEGLEHRRAGARHRRVPRGVSGAGGRALRIGLRRLPENLVPDGAGLRFAFKEYRWEHSPAM